MYDQGINGSYKCINSLLEVEAVRLFVMHFNDENNVMST